MKLTKRQLRRVIRESILNEMGFRDMSGGHGRQRSYQDMEGDNRAACVQKCLAAIPPNMKKICSMGMGHMVINDVWHICSPICDKMGCDCDDVSEEVHNTLCGR